MYKLYYTICILFILIACSPVNSIKKKYRLLSNYEQTLADSLISYALDHEALYSLLDTLKPISSIKFMQLPLFSSNTQQVDSAKQVLNTYQKIINQLSHKNWEFVLNPFERTDSIYKNFEIYVVNKTKLKLIVERNQAFYHTLGIDVNSHPAQILAITEYEQKYNRWRSYGYLFGYPNYAVDFFVNAGKEQDSTKQFVKRDFFHIPVNAANAGYFTYAVPKGYAFTTEDSTLYFKAKKTLGNYQKNKRKYLAPNGIKAVKMWYKEGKLS
ncbi:MAG: hypothetical protein ACOVQE_08390 [Chitinophagaceae bacterium]